MPDLQVLAIVGVREGGRVCLMSSVRKRSS